MAAVCVALLSLEANAEMTPDEIQKLPAAKVEARLPDEHPAAFYLYAVRLFGEGRKGDAVFWFYVGQLRFRFHLAANPGLPAGGDPALMAALNSTVGGTVNEYAGGNPRTWAAEIDRALRWDAGTGNGFTSKERHAKEWQEIRSGLSSLRATIERDADKIRRQREAAGLENRKD